MSKAERKMPEKQTEMVLKVQKHRDMTAFRDLVNLNKEQVYYLIRKMVRNHEDSQDLLQETFIRSLKNIDRLKNPGKYSSWIYSIAVNQVIDFKRKKHSNGHVSLDGEVPAEILSNKLVVEDKEHSINNGRKEYSHALDKALLKLPINHREAFLLYHYEKLSVSIIAEHMDCPEATVRSYIFRAIKKLKVYLKDYYQSIKD